LTGAEPVYAESRIDDDWRMDPAALDRLDAGGRPIRGVILNSPNNPTGAVVDPDDLARIARWCAEHDAWLIYDETYDRFVYDGRTHASGAKLVSAEGRVVVTGAASKTYAMTGWRLGWAVGPPGLITAMTSYQSHTTSNASSISQAAALEALNDVDSSEAAVADMLSQYASRRAVMYEGLAAVPGVRCGLPEGAFYVFADVSGLYAPLGISGSAAFCDRLLAEAHVATVPGDAFGADSCVRFSFASRPERIREGIRRIQTWAKRAASLEEARSPIS
jgi:aspartate aminotransferase